jgi:hypothetical protein
MGKAEVGGAAGKPSETAEHLEKVAGGTIRRASAAIWWKKRVPPGNGATRRHDGAVAIWCEVGEMGWPIREKMLVSPTGMACGIFGRSRRLRSPPCALGFHRMRRMKKHPTSDENQI